MITAFFNLIFKIIGFIANIILTPLFALVSTLIPSTADYMDNIDFFVDYAISNTSFIAKFFMVPSSLLKLFFAFCGSLLVGFVSVGVIRLSMKIYETFKP